VNSRRRSSWIGGVAILWVALTGSLASQQPVIGYTDTPMQPDGMWRIHDLNRPRPRVVAPGALVPVPPPADAVILLGPGADLAAWQADNGTPVSWPVADGVMQTGRGMVRTRAVFGDIQLHVEFATPATVQGASQGRGNSGVFLAGVFEIQVLDSWENPTYADGQAAAMYGQFPPLVNASRPPGEWQSYDIVFIAPRFSALGGAPRFGPGHRPSQRGPGAPRPGILGRDHPPRHPAVRAVDGPGPDSPPGPRQSGPVPEHLGAGDHDPGVRATLTAPLLAAPFSLLA